MSTDEANDPDAWKRRGGLGPDEDPDVRREAARVLKANATAWLETPNPRFGFRTPADVIESGEEFWVRDVLRAYLGGGGA